MTPPIITIAVKLFGWRYIAVEQATADDPLLFHKDSPQNRAPPDSVLVTRRSGLYVSGLSVPEWPTIVDFNYVMHVQRKLEERGMLSRYFENLRTVNVAGEDFERARIPYPSYVALVAQPHDRLMAILETLKQGRMWRS